MGVAYKHLVNKWSISIPVLALVALLAAMAVLFSTQSTWAQSVPLNAETVTYDENDTVPVGRYRASDPDDGSAIVWTVGGTDANDFEIDEDTGVLTFKEAPDFEDPTDRDSSDDSETANIDEGADAVDNDYEVNVLASGTHQVRVIVTVKNLEEEGTIKLSTLQPEKGVELTGEGLADEDGDDPETEVTSGDNSPAAAPEYQWAASPNGRSGWANIKDAEAIAYTPVQGDVGKYLRLTAEYGRDADRETASVVSANAVQEHNPTNSAPVFPDQDPVEEGPQTGQTREVPENSDEGTAVGAPVVANDDRGALTYTLSGSDDDADFDIDRGYGPDQGRHPN